MAQRTPRPSDPGVRIRPRRRLSNQEGPPDAFALVRFVRPSIQAEALVRLPTRAGSAVPGRRVAAGDPRRLAAAERDRLDETIVRRGRRVAAVEQQGLAVP